MKRNLKKLVALLLTVSFLLSGMGMPVSAAQDEQTETQAPDTTTWDTIDGGTQPMYSSDHAMTVAVFGGTNCQQTMLALIMLERMNFSKEDVDIFFIDIQKKSKSEVESYAERMKTSGITYCYDVSGAGFSHANDVCYNYTQTYVGPTDNGAVYMPTYVFTDNTGRVRKVISARSMDDVQTTGKLAALFESFGCGDLVPEDKKPAETKFEATYSQTDARKMLSRINTFRTGDDAWEWDASSQNKINHENLGGLVYDYELEKIAMQRAAELVVAYSHTRPNEMPFHTAYSDAFEGIEVGENIAIGATLPEEGFAFTLWREENEQYSGQGHRRNMLSEGYEAVGIAHLCYKGCHYWVQEFGSRVVGGTETEPNDSPTEVSVSFYNNFITEQTLKSEADAITMEVGEEQALPKIYRQIRTQAMWENAPSLEIPALTGITISCASDMVNISDGRIYALKEGSCKVKVTDDNTNKTIQIPVTVKPNLAAKKAEAKEQLEAYLGDISGYNSEQQAGLQEALEAGKADIDKADTVDAVTTALSSAKVKIRNLKTLAQQEGNLAAAKAYAKEQLEAYLEDVSSYTPEQQAELKQVIETGKADIEKADTMAALYEVLNRVDTEIQKIQDMAEEEEKAKLLAAKTDAKQKLQEYAEDLVTKNTYREAEKAQFEQDMADGIAKIDAAQDEASVEKSLEWTIAQLDSIKTDEQWKKEEQLATVKETAKEELESYKQDKKTTNNQTTWDLYVNNGKKRIDAAKDETAVQTVLAEVKANIDKIISGGIVLTEEEQKLLESKINALDKLEAYQTENIKEEDYDLNGWMDIETIAVEARAAIDNASDEEKVTEALEKAIAAFKKVKTKAQKQEEEEAAAQRLAEAKAAAKAELEQYLENLDAYRAKQKTELQNVVNAGIKSVNSAADESKLKNRLAEAKAKVEAIKTDAQLTAQEKASELSKAKKAAKTELENYKNAKNYRTAQKTELENAIKAGKKAIDAAKDKMAVEEALKTAKKALDEIKTAAQLKKEEAAKKPADISKKGKVELSVDSYTYDGKAKKPDAVVSVSGKTLLKDTDYTVTYQNNTEVGTAFLTVTGKGNYTGKLTKKFEIIPKGISVSGKIKAQKKGFLVKWKKAKNITGYEVSYSTSKKFTKKTTKKKVVKKASATQLSVKKLKAKKKYYVRIRTYKTVKGKKYYSAWSKAKTVTTKK